MLKNLKASLASLLRSYKCMSPGCKKVCRNARGLKQHMNAIHPNLSSDESDNEAQAKQSTRDTHPFLNGDSFHSSQCVPVDSLLPYEGVPVDIGGVPLPEQARPPTWKELDQSNPWSPFDDRLGFEFCHHHYADAQSSASKVNKALDFWVAAKIQALKTSDCEHINAEWDSAKKMYETIDKIQLGSSPFSTVKIRYSGPRPDNPPSWMNQEYELCYRDTRKVLHDQLATADFASDFDPAPYRQYQANGERVWSNLMSGEWAWDQAVRITSNSTKLELGLTRMVILICILGSYRKG